VGSSNFLTFVTQVITFGDVGSGNVRSKDGLTGLTPADLTLVTDARTCAKAAALLDQLANRPTSARQVYVVKAGTKRYFVNDPNDRTGEWGMTFVTDAKFAYIDMLLGL
jgi:hypothetical protein